MLLLLATADSRRSSQLFDVQQEKHNSIKLLAQAKLDSICDVISKAIQDENISPAEFLKILQETKKYHKLKEEIRRKNKAKVRETTKEQKRELLD